jgi:hypothetical protein
MHEQSNQRTLESMRLRDRAEIWAVDDKWLA